MSDLHLFNFKTVRYNIIIIKITIMIEPKWGGEVERITITVLHK